MKRKVISVLLFLIGGQVWSQVGVNTDDPKAMLDINGNLRVRTAEKCLDEACTESILVKNSDGYVQTVSKDQVFNSNGRSYVSGTGNGGTMLVSISLLPNWGKILFDKELMDDHNDYDPSIGTFTAPKDGIYAAYVQVKTSSVVSAGDFGVGIYVKRGSAAPELMAEESYAGINVLSIDVSPSTRKTQSIVSLKAGDQLFFCAKSTLATLNLITGASSSFTIYQIK
ncbi:C1q-like domain-containing protein [Chryseobacterium shigense]|uniref:C1q domain-containing protein n=1 Tax=Chryseobacterium shigense TaxID=297244 RepID=A0A841N223_9FLAO|nr:hypothetical protein [Chryseobacterium shigense]MBB6369193.1 hypothetical protein [Chryseobacterium shigense]